VLGQFEKMLLPEFSIENTPQHLLLKVSFRTQNGVGIIKIEGSIHVVYNPL